MNEAVSQLAGPLANYPFVDTEDAASARQRISALLIPHELEVHRGLLPFRAVHRHVALRTISLHYLRYEPEVTMTWPAPRSFYLLVVPMSGMCRVGGGRRRVEVAPGECIMLNPTIGPRFDMIGNCEALFVKMPAAEILARLAVSGKTTAATMAEFDTRRAVSNEACGGLVDLVQWLCRDVDHVSSVGMNPVLGPRVEDLLIETVLSACPRIDAVTPSMANFRSVPQNVRRCEEFVELHAGDRIAISEMAEISGGSERALFQAFRDHRQTSPMAYLKARRLDGAHADLARADGARCTVSQIARTWGFADPGYFAREYRRKFGRIPSDTLREEPHPGYPDRLDATGDV